MAQGLQDPVLSRPDAAPVGRGIQNRTADVVVVRPSTGVTVEERYTTETRPPPVAELSGRVIRLADPGVSELVQVCLLYPDGSWRWATFDIYQTTDSIRAPAGSMLLRGGTPTVRVDASVDVPAASMLLRGGTPTVGVETNIRPPAAAMVFQGYAPEILVLPAPEPGSYLGWDANGNIVNLSPTDILDQIASSTPLAGWWIDTGA